LVAVGSAVRFSDCVTDLDAGRTTVYSTCNLAYKVFTICLIFNAQNFASWKIGNGPGVTGLVRLADIDLI